MLVWVWEEMEEMPLSGEFLSVNLVHLKVLKEVGLVENRRDSKTIFYAINKKGAMSIQAQL